MATMAEVAALAGVSTATVSHVLNGTRAVQATTRAKVERAIQDTGYRPNQVARSLATASTRTVGLAMSMLGRDSYFAEIAHAIETGARRAGYNLVYADTHDDPEVEERVIAQFLSQRLDGMIWASTAYPLTPVHPGIPTVLVDRMSDEPCDRIGPEDVAATAELTGHLAGHGHRRVALLAGLDGLSTTAERIQGFRQAVQQHGLDADPDLVVHAGSRVEPARLAVHAMLRGPRPPTAIVSGNNAMTVGLLRALRELGAHAPADVALACYDDFDWADLLTPALTAMRQQIPVMGGRSLDLLLARIADPAAPFVLERVPPVFMVRESCGCPTGTVPPGAALAGSAEELPLEAR